MHREQLINAHKLEAAKQYVALLVKNLPAMQETLVQFLNGVWKIPWRRDRLPMPVFLCIPVAQLVRIRLQCGRSGFNP